VSKRSRKRTLEVSEIIRLYQEGESTTNIAAKANISSRYVLMILKDNDVKLRPRGSWKRKYTLNEDYFKVWSNNMAYILGFLIADGTVSREGQFVSIAQKEKYILENIKQELGSNQPLYQNKQTGVYILNINSKIIKHDLINIHGVIPNKSSTIKFPHVPNEHMSHFVRGYFDGDGYVNYNQYTVTFVGGSKSFMLRLINILTTNGFITQFQQQDKNFRVHIRGRKSIKLFSDWIYKDKAEDLYLIRKYDVFKKEKLEAHQLVDSKHSNEIKAVFKRKLNFLVIYAITNSFEYTCTCINISPKTVRGWIRKDKSFETNFNFLNKNQSA